jgi:hypothetical protein
MRTILISYIIGLTIRGNLKMGSSDKGGPPLTRAEWFKIFNLVSAHKELEEVKEVLHPRNRTTTARAFNAARELIRTGNTPLGKVKIQQIKKLTSYGATERFIYHAESEYRAWLQHHTKSVVKDDINVAGSKYVEENDLHLKKLNTLAMQIRNNIVNPHRESKNYPSYTSTWMYGGQDWRLTIASWATLMLPYLHDEKLWNKPISISYLYEHIKRSPFKQHYDELNQEINKLRKEFFVAAEKIKVINPQMFTDWDALNDDWDSYLINVKPINSLMPLDKICSSECDPQYFAEVLATFREYIVDLDNRYIVLEDLLQQVYDDLDEIEIQDVIKKGICEKCPV